MDLQSILGYARNSPFSSSPYLDIQTPEGLINMANTPIDLLGIDNLGNAKVMKAGRKNPYKFRGNKVREIPMQQGGIPPMVPGPSSGTVTIYQPQDVIKTIRLEDKRKINPATGKPFQKTGTKSTTVKEGDVKKIVAHAKAQGVDPYTILAITLQESNINAKDGDFGHVDEVDQSNIPNSVPDEELNKYIISRAFKDKMEYANTLIKQGKLPNTEAYRIQAYNGLGKLFPGTEDWNGRNRAFYEIPVTNRNPLDLRKNPAYGKTIISLRDSVIKTNPDIVKAIEQAEAAKYRKGGKMKKKRSRGNPYQKGGYSPQQLFDFIFDDDVEDPVKNNVPVAPTTTEVDAQVALNDFEAQRRQMESMENDQMAMDIMGADMGNPYSAQRRQGIMAQGQDILSAGQFGAQNIGNFGMQIYGKLASDLGYAPVANSIYRSKEQNDALIAKGAPAAKNSWHLTGNAIDLKPADWHRLSDEQQSFYRSNYDVVYHNNHYHIEPK